MKNKILLFTCLHWLLNNTPTGNATLSKSLVEDGRLNFTGLGVKYGHQVEVHEVVTEDGYILHLFRIPGKRKNPVLLMHGIADSADTFIIRGNTSLVVTLANAGYDVWAGNLRGNKYSRRHVKLNPDEDLEFWGYSFNEGGYYNLPAMIDYILKTTGESKLQTIGHSQGTTMHFVLLSTRPEYNEKIKIFIALAPVAFVSHFMPPLSIISQYGPALGEVFKSLQIEEAFNENSLITSLLRLICSQNSLSYELCFLTIGFNIAGFDIARFEPRFLKVLFGHYPSSTSRKSLIHWAQMVLSKRFCRFDYGAKGNKEHYGNIVPPDYNVSEVTVKVALLVGRNDLLTNIKDVKILRKLLPNIVDYHVMEPKLWNHIDFVWGNDMAQTLFPTIFQLLEEYE